MADVKYAMVKIAGVQFGNIDKEDNIPRATQLIKEATSKGANIVCLPEVFSTMYFCLERNPQYPTKIRV